MKAIKKEENIENYEMLTHSKRGDPIWLNVSIICIPGSQPALNTVVHMFRDITKQKMDINLINMVVSDINNANKVKNNHLSKNQSKTQNILTPRERMVLECLGAGYRPIDISDKLYISLSTLRKHIKNIHSKLEVHSMLEAVAKARQSDMM
jgi:ATP/maltotriose-dependent transcriptional regulator MalT